MFSRQSSTQWFRGPNPFPHVAPCSLGKGDRGVVRTHWFPKINPERASLLAQMVKNPPWMQEAGFDSWVGKILWSRKWVPTPVFLLEESHGQRSLVGYSPWGCKESDMTEWLALSLSLSSSFSSLTGNSRKFTHHDAQKVLCAHIMLVLSLTAFNVHVDRWMAASGN